VFVYRLYGFGTIEDTLYKLNIQKVALSKSVVDKKGQSNWFKRRDLQQYFSLPDLNAASLVKEEPLADQVAVYVRTALRDALIEFINHDQYVAQHEDQLNDEDLVEATAHFTAELERINTAKAGIRNPTVVLASGVTPTNPASE
jgi:hypothetical protein